MALSFDEIWVYGGQLVVAKPLTNPKALGEGLTKIDWSAYIQGSLQVGAVDDFGEGDYPGTATVMVGRTDTKETPLSINTRGNVRIEGDGGTANGLWVTGGASVDALHVEGDAFFSGAVDCGNKGKLAARFAAADASPKPFDLEHPTKGKGHRLRHACIEGPEVAVYYRGRLRGSNKIFLPYYWKDLVHEESITVQLQPIGDRHFHLNVVAFTNEWILVKEADDKPIDCFYHVYGERKDINPLITEYEGDGWEDYPDPNYDPNKVDSEEKNTKDPRFAGPPNTITK